jgi:hypothetical protein
MNNKNYAVIAVMAMLSDPVAAGDMYKCSNNGVVAYQHKPCAESAEQTVLVEKKLSKSEIDASEVLEEGISLSPLLVKKDHIDRLNGQWFAYQATAINNTDNERKVSVPYKGVDSAGFEVKKIYLRGTVKSHSTKILTDKDYAEVPEFNRIQQWVLDR